MIDFQSPNHNSIPPISSSAQPPDGRTVEMEVFTKLVWQIPFVWFRNRIRMVDKKYERGRGDSDLCTIENLCQASFRSGWRWIIGGDAFNHSVQFARRHPHDAHFFNLIYSSPAFQRARSQLQRIINARTARGNVSETPDFANLTVFYNQGHKYETAVDHYQKWI